MSEGERVIESGSEDCVFWHCALVCCFLLCCAVLCCVVRLGDSGRCENHQESMGSFFLASVPALALVMSASLCFLESLSPHGFPDVLWLASLCVDAISVVPQLQLARKGVVDRLVSHHVIAFFLSRLFALQFWWLIRGLWFQGTGPFGCGILAVYTWQLLLLSHFSFYYLRDAVKNGPFSCVPLVLED